MRSTLLYWDFKIWVVKGFLGKKKTLKKITQVKGKMTHMPASETSWKDQNVRSNPFVASLEHARWRLEPSLYRVLFSHTWLCNFGWMPSSQSKLRSPNRGPSNLQTSTPLKQRLNFEIWSFNKAEFLICQSLRKLAGDVKGKIHKDTKGQKKRSPEK